MNVFDKVKYLTDKELSKRADSPKAALVWFITEIVQIVVCIIGAILLLWFYAPFSFLLKLAITFLSLIVVFDVFKNFIYVRWILYKESL